MVLLCNANHINIKNNHMLKCIEKKKNSFNIFVMPLKNILEETHIIDNNKNKNIIISDLSDIKENDINTIFQSNPK